MKRIFFLLTFFFIIVSLEANQKEKIINVKQLYKKNKKVIESLDEWFTQFNLGNYLIAKQLSNNIDKMLTELYKPGMLINGVFSRERSYTLRSSEDNRVDYRVNFVFSSSDRSYFRGGYSSPYLKKFQTSDNIILQIEKISSENFNREDSSFLLLLQVVPAYDGKTFVSA